MEPSDCPSQLYYMKQTVSNACGTVALLHCVANAQRFEIEPLCENCYTVWALLGSAHICYSSLQFCAVPCCPEVKNIHFALLSTGRLELVPGSPLQVFLEATAKLSPEERADRLENDAEIVRVHDEAAREGQTAPPNLEDQVFLFLDVKLVSKKI